jgi:endonuclease/exonuclease/phosphatase family metal-dependent hydrolase
MKIILSFLFVCILTISVSFAQSVTPNDRVSSSLNVRDMPSGTVIGSLEIGETALLITDTIPYWYMILYEGTDTGYVHKAWSKLIEELKNELVIGSWNIKWFGSSTTDKHDYPAMADIVQEMDLVAIQEVKGDHYTDRLDSLAAELARRGYQYDYIVSEETGYDENPISGRNDYVERYAYFWDVDRLEILRPDTPYYFISTPIINNSHFRAVPIVSEFKVKGGQGFDFKITTIHTVYNANIEEVRGTEIQFLHDWMNEQVFDLEIPEKDVFIIGDFNANPDRQTAFFDSITTDTTGYRIIFNEPLKAGEASKRTTILYKQNITAADHLLPAYDHLLLSKHTSYAIPIYPVTWASGIIGVVEFDQEEKFRTMNSRFEVIAAMSDHRPIWIKMSYDTEDRD